MKISIKFQLFLFEFSIFASANYVKTELAVVHQTVRTSIARSVTRLSDEWQTRVKPFLRKNQSKMRKKISRFNSSDVNSTILSGGPYKLRNIIAGAENSPTFNDPYFSSQFYMIPTQRSPGHKAPYDLNVFSVWIRERHFGANIRIMILDDGIDADHPELKDNFDLAFELNPRISLVLDPEVVSYEGTKVAGIIAMKANNGHCGVGVAPLAKFGVIRFSSPTNEDFAKALLFKTEEVDIFFTSWAVTYKDHALSPYIGPLLQAYERTATKGRGGKGVIHVVPVGNRGHELYMCGSNVILQSIYTIGVAGSDYDGRTSDYSEYCASVMVTAYSSFGLNDEYMTVVPDINGTCTRIHGGSGTAAALVTGIIALALNARPCLTWREIQHAIVWTSEVSPLQQDLYIWKINGAGFYISEFFGFGMINAYNLVRMAKSMKHIPPMVSCVQAVYDYAQDHFSYGHPSKKVREYKHRISNCTGTQGNAGKKVNYIEHVQLRVSLIYPSKRGDIVITLKSPSGTETTLLDSQPNDHSTKGMVEWYFDSVMMWGETPEGEWIIKIAKHFSVENTPEIYVQRVYLLIHGTQSAPPHYYSPLDMNRRIRPYRKPVPAYLPPRTKRIISNGSNIK